jgi:molybdenum cofactor biosynthesis enzyme
MAVGEVAFRLVQENGVKKGDVLAVAEVAGTMAAKATATLIPLCHPLTISSIRVNITPLSEGINTLISDMYYCMSYYLHFHVLIIS